MHVFDLCMQCVMMICCVGTVLLMLCCLSTLVCKTVKSKDVTFASPQNLPFELEDATHACAGTHMTMCMNASAYMPTVGVASSPL